MHQSNSRVRACFSRGAQPGPRAGWLCSARFWAAHLAPSPATPPPEVILNRKYLGGRDRSCPPRTSSHGTDDGSFVPSATYHLTGDGDDLDRFDPDTAARAAAARAARARVLNGIVGDAWAKIEERHPEVAVSLSGAQQKGR